MPYRSPTRRTVAPFLLANEIQSKMRYIKASYLDSCYCQSRRKEVVAHIKLVPRSLGASERFRGFGETFQGLVVDARVDENASIGCPMPVSHRESGASRF